MKAILFTDPHRGYNDNTSRIHDKVFSSIDQSLFDLVIVSGDWGTSKLKDVKNCFKAFRKAFPDKVILGVLGNHDFWDKETKSMMAKFAVINKYAKEYNIHLLENNPYETEEVIFLGFNGWYHYPHLDTRDSDYMTSQVNGQPIDLYLKDLADKAIYSMIDHPKGDKTVVSITHFPCIESVMDKPQWNGNPKHGELLLEFSDLIIFGHTHRTIDVMVNETRVVNVGSDSTKPLYGYNQLQYKIIDLANLKI